MNYQISRKRTLSKAAISIAVCSLLPFFNAAHAQRVISFTSTEGNYWKVGTHERLSDKGTATIVINSNSDASQTFKGWGTCFNELDWDAYSKMTSENQKRFNKRLFNPSGDLKMSVGRIAVGASDYGRSWYSCDEVDSTDFDMSEFNINRDLTSVIPSIKAAQAENPNMTFWASPWSPPQWMKTNKHYAQRRTSTNGCPFSVAPYDNDQFIAEDRYYNAYCLYFDKYISAFGNQGIPITALAYQNEAYSYTPYPGCSWKAATTGKFLADYLGPYMEKHQPDLKLIFGTCNTNRWDVFTTVLGTANISKYVDIVGLQWEGGLRAAQIKSTYPQYELWQTESECGSGTFDWSAAAHTFQLINHYLANGITTYTYWNAILEGSGTSTWGWKQNALIQVNSGVPTYTPEYYAFKHYSHLITPGSTILKCDESNLLLSAKTPEGSIIVVIGNNQGMARDITFSVDGKYITTSLPGNSFRSYIIADDDTMLSTLKAEAQSLIYSESVSAEAAAALSAAITKGDIDTLQTALTEAMGDVNEIKTVSENKITDPSFEKSGNCWFLNNTANSGDFKFTTKAGHPCWNSWSNDFTSMDIHQTITGLPAGEYKLRCLSMTGDADINDQHAYVIAGEDTVVSPAKKLGGIDVTWEKQTTNLFTVGSDGKITIGYASTSGGGTKGWFCVTGFQLIRVVNGKETRFDVANYGTKAPTTEGAYYLYDITQSRYVQIASSGCGTLSYEPDLTFFPKETAASTGYYTFCTSARSDWFFKSGYYNNMYTWFDGTAAAETGQWYLTAGKKGVRLDVGQYDDGNTKPLRTADTKYYLYYNGSVMAFTTDTTKSDEFIFVDENAYKTGLTDYFTNGGTPVDDSDEDSATITTNDIISRGTISPVAGEKYYLYDVTRELMVTTCNGGWGNKNGGVGSSPITFTASTGTDVENESYVTLSQQGQASVDGALKVADWNGYHSWLDGVAGNGNVQWHLISSSQSNTQGTCTMYVRSLADATLNTASTAKYYLYANASNQLYGITDSSKADLYVFITPSAYQLLTTNIAHIYSDKNIQRCYSNKTYNIAGLRVSDDYQGVVIKDGKKWVNKQQ